MQTIKTTDYGYVRLYGNMPKSVSVGLSCGLSWTMALFVTHSDAEETYAACGASEPYL